MMWVVRLGYRGSRWRARLRNNTLIGTLVGIAFSFLVPVSIPNARARVAVRGVARSQAGLLDEVSLTIASRRPHPQEVTEWRAWADHLGAQVQEARSAVRQVAERRRFNPLALTTSLVHPGLSETLTRLDRTLVALRALLSGIAMESAQPGQDAPDLVAAELRRAFAVLLDHMAHALRAFAEVVEAQFGSGDPGQVQEAVEETVETIAEARAVVTELVLIDVDPRQQTGLWMLQGSVLAAVQDILGQLDLDLSARPTQAWLPRQGSTLLVQRRPTSRTPPPSPHPGSPTGR